MLEPSYTEFVVLVGVAQGPITVPTFVTLTTDIPELAMQTSAAAIVLSYPCHDMQLWGPMTGYRSLILTQQCHHIRQLSVMPVIPIHIISKEK